MLRSGFRLLVLSAGLLLATLLSRVSGMDSAARPAAADQPRTCPAKPQKVVYTPPSFPQYTEGPAASTPETQAPQTAGLLSAAEQVSLTRHIRKRLPQYRALFHKIASESDLDWRLIAAISYQESHWHPKAKSPTGVRGLMMLTQVTAREQGITNRLDAAQSVRGGVGYLQKLLMRLPASIPEPERIWHALAAYNVGIGHLYDARELARQLELDPDNWQNLRRSLVMLEDPQWYTQTRHGYARGSEPVKYVDNIQRYYRHISSQFKKPEYNPKGLPTLGAAKGNAKI